MAPRFSGLAELQAVAREIDEADRGGTRGLCLGILPRFERAQTLALDSIRALDVLPVFGEPMLRLFTSDRTVPSLLFFVRAGM